LSAGEELMANRAYLAQLLSIADDGAATGSALTPQGRQARYVELVRGVARAATSDPLLLILNDVHWSDPSSIDLLRWLLPLHAELPMLIALVTRPDRESVGWRLVEAAREAAGAALEEIALQPLLADEGHRLLANLLEQHELPPTVAELVDDRAEGNPLFVEEMVHMLVDHGILTRGPDGWELRNEVGGADIPDTLQGLLAARIDRLEPEARTALRVASVIGRQFAVPVLERLLVRVQ
jgi:predicted ATPase